MPDRKACAASASARSAPAIDGLANIVGGIRDSETARPFVTITEPHFDETFEFNLKGIFHLMKALAPGRRERGSGAIIVNVSSDALYVTGAHLPVSGGLWPSL